MNAHYGLAQSENGWQTQDSFYDFVTIHLDRELKARNIKRPFMYFVDGHKSHISYKLRKWCRDNKIVLITFYPNSTHILQMCDTSIFGPVKRKWSEVVQTWKSETGNREVDEVVFVKLLKQLNDAVIKKESIIKGFASTGIYPLDKSKVHYERCLGARFQVLPENLLSENLESGK